MTRPARPEDVPALLALVRALAEYEREPDAVVATEADLHAALGCLSQRDRQLLELRYEEDLTQAAIATKLGIPEGTVKVRLHRARDKLRRAYVVQ